MRCFRARWAISRAADGAPLTERVRRHVDDCRDCEAFERRTEWLGRSLGRASARAPAPEEPTRLPRHLGVAGLVAAGAIAVALVVGNGDEPEPEGSTEPAAAVDPEPEPQRAEPLDVRSLAADAEGGIRYVLRVSGLPEPR